MHGMYSFVARHKLTKKLFPFSLLCCRLLPDKAKNFTTVELKSNFVSTALEGELTCRATQLHGGKTTQVWDATVLSSSTGKPMAYFRATQLIMY